VEVTVSTRDSQSEPLLQIENLTKVFHIRQGFSSQDFLAVDNASIVIDSEKPEIFAVVGESGSGKTTLAKMVLGMETSSQGILRYKNRVINDISRKEMKSWFYREVQPVFQDPFAAFSPLKRIDSYLYETAQNYKMVADKKETPRYINEVLSEVGHFGGLFALGDYDEPVLVSSTDGVGTKLKIAFMTGRHDTVGFDIVAHCANDILVQGAEPLFFLDYIGTSKLYPDVVEQIVTGLAAGCREINCAFIGGETAELPEFYREGEYDLVGTIVGVVERSKVITGNEIRPGDQLIGLSSLGLHTNGFSLARRILLFSALPTCLCLRRPCSVLTFFYLIVDLKTS